MMVMMMMSLLLLSEKSLLERVWIKERRDHAMIKIVPSILFHILHSQKAINEGNK